MSILAPINNPRVSGAFGNSPEFYQQYGQRGHNGTDYAVDVGTPVYATDSGTVMFEGWGANHSWMGEIAGISIILSHGWGFSGYAHLSRTIVNYGQKIKRGQLIGYSGATGVGTGPHLHFETFPKNPNFGNGFAGRVNPSVFGVVPRSTTARPSKPKPPKPKPAAKPKPKPIPAPIPVEDEMHTTYMRDPKDKNGTIWMINSAGKRRALRKAEWDNLKDQRRSMGMQIPPVADVSADELAKYPQA